MKQFKLHTKHKQLLADLLTPVSIYLSLRDHFSGSLLLESSDYSSKENCYSYICCEPIAEFKVEGSGVFMSFPGGSNDTVTLQKIGQAQQLLQKFANAFKSDNAEFSFASSGLFGYTSYDAIQHFEDIEINNSIPESKRIPEMLYRVFRHVLVIDHHKNTLHYFEHTLANEESNHDQIIALIQRRSAALYNFQLSGNEETTTSNKAYLEMAQKAIAHCQRGDVFQLVLSREFSQKFLGDDFNVYRSLRAINPSPYLFYFDYGGFKLFGSSPEAQLQVKNQVAMINPIAGTYKRSGSAEKDARLAEKLKKDAKENAEHVMLVDLARNDLSRNAKNVTVETFGEIQYYSHVIHMVSKVCGKVDNASNVARLFAESFPAGTLSGAPKHKAMQLINKYEKSQRGFYGGAIGFMGFNGDFNHAIMIRTFLSKNNQLTYQAGAGIVAKSIPENELQEVENKITALRKAIKQAQTI